MSRTLHLFGTDWCAMMVPIQVIRWYRMQCYDGTDSCAIVVPIRRYCQILYKESSTDRLYQVNFSTETEEKVNKIYQELGKPSLEEHCFISKKKCVYSIQRINILLKQVSQEYLRGEVLFTTSTLRRTFGREYLKRAGMSSLNTLGVFFNQDSEEFTMNYLRLYSNTLISLPRLCAVIRRQK